MRKYLLIMVLQAAATLGFAQATESKINYQKTQQTAAMIELPYSTAIVENAVDNSLSAKGVKGSNSKGFKVYKNVRWTADDTVVNDLYFKIERKSQSEAAVYLVVANPNENIANRNPDSSSALHLEEARQFLNTLAPTAEASNTEVQIKNQEEAVSKAEKRLKSLTDEGNDLNKRLLSIKQKIVDNESDVQKQKDEVEKQRQALSTLINKRKS